MKLINMSKKLEVMNQDLKRDSTIFYRSFYEAIRELPDNVQIQIYNSIFEYSLNFMEVELDGMAKTIFTLIKPQLEANIQRYKNGKKGGRVNRNDTEMIPKHNQKGTKPEPNKNDNGNDNGNGNGIRERKESFYKSLTPSLEKYSQELLNEFFEYWSEHGEKDKKMRFEKEKSFGISRRLSTWAKRQKQWEKEKSDGEKRKEPASRSFLAQFPNLKQPQTS